MSNVMGGGGGRGGFKHMFNHLGLAMQGWLADMQAHAYQFTDANLDVLDKSVQQELDVYDPDIVAHQRDKVLLNLLKDKMTASALV
jgi:3-hydroxyacyl-CoA dehydrogenase